MPNYRRLTSEEITRLITAYKEAGLDVTHEEYDPRTLRQYTDFATKYFGPAAHRIRIKVGSEYNDEGYDHTIERVSVYDNNGNRLYPLGSAFTSSLRSSYRDDYYSTKLRSGSSLDEDDLEDLVLEIADSLPVPGVDEDDDYPEDHSGVYNFYVNADAFGRALYVLED